jgi:hypothetical protein
MMLANDELRVVLVTIHMSLRKAIDAVTFDAVLQTLRITHAPPPAWGQTRPRIAVAGPEPARRRRRAVWRRGASHHRPGRRGRAWPKA